MGLDHMLTPFADLHAGDMYAQSTPVVYHLDANDRISYVNRTWDRFALANDSPALCAPGVLDRALWDLITGAEIGAQYHFLLAYARTAHRSPSPFGVMRQRCVVWFRSSCCPCLRI
jgi:hypothetical protein